MWAFSLLNQNQNEWKHFQLLTGAMNSYSIYYGYKQLQDASNMTPLTLVSLLSNTTNSAV